MQNPVSANLSHEDSQALRARARAAAERISLPFRQGLRGSTGNLAGTGTGSSIDFQDHRPYAPGDDPRHIDWQAYARSGNYTMKLYREEVRPLADIVLDTSASMGVTREKAVRALEVAHFCRESALRHGAAVQLFSIRDGAIASVPASEGWTEAFAAGRSAAPDWSRIPWRAGSLRVVISDLLFPALPGSLITPLLAQRGRPVVFAPFCPEEADPGWLGNWELEDCESLERRELNFQREDLRAYETAYQAHFDLWRGEAVRLGFPLARIGTEGSLVDALTAEGLNRGAISLS